ncbi:dynein light chain Tctex-type protein 2B-like [Daktulosphaira vitifoliae]|uniref:dynein light chain Tctex-type protein 2B-like n=1 Tax=Daktulosphaira vitifoliae TaxID=58002 RepID=UPI0021A979B1|nr:dynein light chain Tctex-type protein 2B-like [Daktulosphaira vitifoliae]
MSISTISNKILEKECSIISFHPVKNDDNQNIDDSPKVRTVNYQNTYRLLSKNPFNETKTLEAVQEELEKYIKCDTRYDPQRAAGICASLSQAVRDRIQDMNFDRYKIVCVVDIGEKKGQGIISIARFLRDFSKDKYLFRNFENHFLFITVMVGAFYFE